MAYKIGFIGAGKACLQMIRLFDFSKEYHVEVICDRNTRAPAMQYALKHDINIVTDIAHLANYALDFLIELTGRNQKVLEQIEKYVSKQVHVIDSDVAKMFFSLFAIMWKSKSEESLDVIEETSIEIQKYIENFNLIQKNISILSINAGIEARRAGEVGLGFAVIAKEIMDMVGRSEGVSKDCQLQLSKLNEIKAQMKSDDNQINV